MRLDFKSLVDSYECNACVISVDLHPDEIQIIIS